MQVPTNCELPRTAGRAGGGPRPLLEGSPHTRQPVLRLSSHRSVGVRGNAVAGDTLVFVLVNKTLGQNAYSDPAMNVSYDNSGETLDRSSPAQNNVTPYEAVG